MLIYDHNKKFLGIDDNDLKHLGFNDATALFDLCGDFADLFVKRPGYIHNFKNFEWIDFVMHADAEVAKAIIHTPKRNYSCKLHIKPFYLVNAPGKEGYQVHLQGLKPLSSEEDAQIAPDLKIHPIPSVAPKSTPDPVQPEPQKSTFIPDVNLPDFSDAPGMELNEPDIFDVPVSEPTLPSYETTLRALEEPKPLKLDIGDIFVPEEAPTTLEFSNEFIPPSITEAAITDSVVDIPPKRSNLPDIPMLGDRLSAADRLFIDSLHVASNYRYDPNIAAQELGLPVDLIEEFIGDFIQQSHDFHEPLFHALEQQDVESIKTLSHKLKGVAANLRIEDSFEVLSTINTSKELDEISANLKYFYHLIAKLEGKEISADAYATSNELRAGATSDERTQELSALQDPFAQTSSTMASVEEKALQTDLPLPVLDVFDSAYDNIQIKTEQYNEATAPSFPQFVNDEPLINIKQSSDEREPLLILESPNFETPNKEEPFLDASTQQNDSFVPESKPSTPVIPLEFETHKVAQEIGLPLEVVLDLVQEFKTDAGRTEVLIQEAVAAFEPQSWQKPARLLKGMSDNLRSMQISKELQMLSQTNDAQKAKTALQNYSGLIAQL
ncbi:MAG: hypothetical protein JXK05_09485 [Campylobacterales bacterium]|nr:hypothetical protein [Campylobacterales bacterium]